MKKAVFNFSIRCHYPNSDYTEHRQAMPLSDIVKWVEAYKFTHPACTSISIKLWFGDLDNQPE